MQLHWQFFVGWIVFRKVYVDKKWKDEEQTNVGTPALVEWMLSIVIECDLDLKNPDNMHRLLLNRRLSQRATQYTRMIAFRNHFWVDDESTEQLVRYNNGVAFMFEMPSKGATDLSMNYVRVLKDTLLPKYGALPTSIILMHCEWMKHEDNRENPKYTRDVANFFMVNFRHKLPHIAEPFIFPSQATLVFFYDAIERPGWKIVLCKEARVKREVVEIIDAFITTTGQFSRLIASHQVLLPSQAMNLVGAIELIIEENLLA